MKVTSIPAFTIYEILVSIAIMAIILSLVNSTINKFQQQLFISSEINQKVNDFLIIRSNLWRECYLSDSLSSSNDTLYIFSKNQSTKYFLKNDSLYRNTSSSEVKEMNTKLKALSIFSKNTFNNFSYYIIFQLGGQCVPFKYTDNNTLKKNINNFYLNPNESN